MRQRVLQATRVLLGAHTGFYIFLFLGQQLGGGG